MKNLKWGLALLMMVLAVFNFSNAEAKKNDSKEKTPDSETFKAGDKKSYTYEEYRAAIDKAVEASLINLGSERIVDFSKELLERDEQLKVRELELDKERESMTMTEMQLGKKMKEFAARQQKFLACIDNIDKKQNDRVTHMVDVIGGMKPAQAAKVLSVQEAGISIKILGLLEPVKVSKIFNLMEKEISARLQKQYMSMEK